MSVDQKAAAQYLLRLRKASMSFQGWMDYYHPDMTWAPWHREFQEVLDLAEKDALVSAGGNPIRKILVGAPPRHAKSFTGTVNFPAYALMRRLEREVMVCGYNSELATTFGRGTRDIVTDKRAVKAFPGLELSKETRAVDFWKTAPGGAYYAVGLGGTTTGRGANLMVVDDPYKTREDAESLTQRRKVWDYYVASLLTRLQPDIKGQPPLLIVTHTRWHPDDLAGRIMETPEYKRGEWLHLNFQALTKKETGVYISRSELPKDDPRFVPDTEMELAGKATKLVRDRMDPAARHVSEEKLVALWPERFPVEYLQKQKELLGDREFAALYQQEPYVIGGNLIKENWFQRYKREDLPKFAAMIFSADTAFKAKTVNDYSVLTLGGITESGDIYVLRVWRLKLEVPDLKRKIVQLNSVYRGAGLRGWYIEDAASGQVLLQELAKGSGVSVLPWKPGATDKFTRAASVTPMIEAGRVFIPEEADWLDDWLDELAAFPSAKHDDQVDSLVILLDVLSRMVVTGSPHWDQPIGSFLGDPSLERSATLFAGIPLHADPQGWAGDKGGFAKLAEDRGMWLAWGE